MSALVQRLRIAARHDHSQGRMMNEAADLIEKQQREIERLKEVNQSHYEQRNEYLKEVFELSAHIEQQQREIDNVGN